MAKTFSSSHGEIAFTDTETGDPAMILMHGLPTSKELWEPVLPLLNPAYRLVTFDLNDYGESEKIGRHMSHKERADVLDELRAYLDLSTFCLVAHDLGSSVAVDYMGKYARHVSKLVLMSPPVYPDFKEPFLVKLVRLPVLGTLLVLLIKPLLFKIGIGDGMVHKERLTPELLGAFSGPFSGSEGRAALLRILRWGRPQPVFGDYPRIVKGITAPTLILQGERDPYIPLNQATRLGEDIADAKVTLIKDGGHFLPIDTPAAVAEALNAFIG